MGRWERSDGAMHISALFVLNIFFFNLEYWDIALCARFFKPRPFFMSLSDLIGGYGEGHCH